MTSPTLKRSFIFSFGFTLSLWLIFCLTYYGGWGPRPLAIYPLELHGLIGIIMAPIIHGSWEHIASNTLPLLLLGTMLFYGYPRSCWYALAFIWVLSGLNVWLFARPSFHFGASGLTHGLFFYLFVIGILRHDRRSIALLMIAFMMYGGMLMTIFPQEPGISYESHFFGGLAGLLAAFAFRHWDPKPVQKHYSWELEEDVNDLGVGYWKPPKNTAIQQKKPQKNFSLHK